MPSSGHVRVGAMRDLLHRPPRQTSARRRPPDAATVNDDDARPHGPPPTTAPSPFQAHDRVPPPSPPGQRPGGRAAFAMARRHRPQGGCHQATLKGAPVNPPITSNIDPFPLPPHVPPWPRPRNHRHLRLHAASLTAAPTTSAGLDAVELHDHRLSSEDVLDAHLAQLAGELDAAAEELEHRGEGPHGDVPLPAGGHDLGAQHARR